MHTEPIERIQAIGESPAFLATLEQASRVAKLQKPTKTGINHWGTRHR